MKTKHIGKIDIKSLKNAILDNNISSDNIILLHPDNFDDIVLEYRDIYNEGFPPTFKMLTVEIIEDIHSITPKNRICITQADEITSKKTTQRIIDMPEELDDITVYRCGGCGTVVYSNGEVPDDNTQNELIKLLRGGAKEKHTYGNCCANKWHSN